MRIRIHCCHPLPDLKAWYHLALSPNNPSTDLIPPNNHASTVSTRSASVAVPTGSASRTILDLKQSLCDDLHVLRDFGLTGLDVSLKLEGFDLLDNSLLDIVRDGDLIQILPRCGAVKVEDWLSQQKQAQEARMRVLEQQVEEPGKRVIGSRHGENDMQIDPPSVHPAPPVAPVASSSASLSTTKKRKRSPGPSNSASTPAPRSKSLSQYTATPRVPPPRSKRQPTPAKSSSSSSSSSTESDADESTDSDPNEAVQEKKDQKEPEKEIIEPGAESDSSSSSASSGARSSSLTPLSESSSSSYSPTKPKRKSPVKAKTKAKGKAGKGAGTKAKAQVLARPIKATRSSTRATNASASPVIATKTISAGLSTTTIPPSATPTTNSLTQTQSQQSTSPLQSQQRQAHHVIPGQGKTQTHQRNARRRTKKLLDKAQLEYPTMAVGQNQTEPGVEIDHESELQFPPGPSRTEPDTTMDVAPDAQAVAKEPVATTDATAGVITPPQVQQVTPPAPSSTPMSSLTPIPATASASVQPSTSATPTAIPAPDTRSPTRATSESTPAPKPKHVSSSNAQPLGSRATPSTSRQSRSRALQGPGSDVAAALNNAFGSNDKEGILKSAMDVDNDGDEEDDDDEEEEEVPVRKPKKSVSAKGASTKPTPKKAGAGASRSSGTASASTTTTQTGEVMMASLGNKNKKKGYKKRLNEVLPQKIVFTADGQARAVVPSAEEVDSPMDAPASAPTTGTETTARSAPVMSFRLIAPSEWQDRGQLPVNMFVTSVDVEQALGAEKKKKKRRRGEDYDHEQDSYHDIQGLTEGQFDDAVERVPLPGDASSKTNGFQWQEAEKEWKTSRVIEKVEELYVGGLFAWEGLDMNPRTSQPEKLLIVGRVISIQHGDTGCQVVVRKLLRPGAQAVNFTSTRLRSETMAMHQGDTGDEPESEESSGGGEEGEVLSFNWEDVVRVGWRCIRDAARDSVMAS